MVVVEVTKILSLMRPLMRYTNRMDSSAYHTTSQKRGQTFTLPDMNHVGPDLQCDFQASPVSSLWTHLLITRLRLTLVTFTGPDPDPDLWPDFLA